MELTFALTPYAPSQAAAGLHPHGDADLLAAAARRDAVAFGRLVSKYHALVYRVVWRMMNGSSEAEDVAQETFLKLWNNPAQVKEAGALKGWLMRVAHNLAMDWHRKRPLQNLADLAEPQDERPGAETELQRSWVGDRVDRAIADLPERQKLAITLVHFEFFPQSEAAAVMELSVDAFESLLARARRALKDQLNGDREELLAAVTEEG